MRSALATGAFGAALLALPAIAFAHIERPAYWPDPRPDHQVEPAAGGQVPKARSLASAFDASRPGETRVVCKQDSMARVRRSVLLMRTRGYALRPTMRSRKMSAEQARGVLSLNQRLAKRCRYHSIQTAVFDAHNNDFIVVMPGVYSEPQSRRQPTQDPRCQKYLTDTDFGGGGAVGVSYRYQWHCPNDQALINVLGRRPGATAPPPPQADRHGIPTSASAFAATSRSRDRVRGPRTS